MISSSIQKPNRVATSILAAATLVLTTFAGALPASASAPTPNANSQYSRTTVNSNWTIGSSSTTTLSGVRGISWYVRYAMDPTALRGKTISFTASVSGVPTGYQGYGSANVSFYDSHGFISSGYLSSNGGGGTPVVVPQAATSMEVSPRINVMNGTYMGSGLNTTPTGTFTPTFDIKADGTSITRSDTYTPNYMGPLTVLHAASQPTFVQENADSTWAGAAGYTDMYQELVTCVDISGMTSGTTLTVNTLVDGVVTTSPSAPNASTIETQIGSSHSRSIVLSQSQISSGEMLKLDWEYFAQTGLNSGNHSAALSVTANGTEVSAPCQLKSASSVTPTLAYSSTPAGLYITVNDNAFQNDWVYTVYKTSDNSVVTTGSGWGSGQPQRIYSCGMNGCSSPVAPGVLVYVKVKLALNLISGNSGMQMAYSSESQPSGSAQLPDPWISVTTPSAGSAPGDAKLVGENIDYAAADPNTAMMSPSASMRVVSDGKNGVLRGGVSFTGCTGQNQPCTVYAKMFRIGSTGIDTAFGVNGVTLATYDGSVPGPNPDSITPAWYGQRNKWSAVIKELDYSSNTPTTSYAIVTGNFSGGAVSSKINLTVSQLLTYCGAGFTGAGISPVSAPTAAPLYVVSCSKASPTAINGTTFYSNKVSYVNVAANGTISNVYTPNSGDWVTDSSYWSLVFSSNVSASASSDVALTLVGYTYTITGMGPSGYTGNIVSRVGAQIKVDGTVTTVATPYTSTATTLATEKSFTFARTTTGVATTGFVRTVSNNVANYNYATLNANGTITEGDPVTWDTVTGFESAIPSFVDGQDVGTTGKIQLLRRVGLFKIAAATLDLDTKQIDTGEIVTYANSTDSRVINFTFLDAQGRVNWMFTSAASKLSLVRWNGVSGGGALPDGVTVTSVSTKYITNAAAVVTVTGTGLGNIAGGKVSILGTLVTPSTKSATKLVFTVPAGTVAGDIQINATFGGSDATIATVTRVGAIKQDQVIADTQDAQATWSGVGAKTTVTFPVTTDKGLATTVKVDKAAICSVSGQTVTMNAAGTCVVTVSSAGDLGTSAASQTTTIVVTKRDKGNLNSILTAVNAAAGAWTGTNIVATIPSLLTSVGLSATVTVAPAAVCSLAGAVLTIKAAGTCVVSVTGAADAGTDAIAKTVANVVVTKGNMALDVPATNTLSNNPADDNNVENIDAGIANGAVADAVLTYSSSNEDVCNVDENGNVTGVAVGTCVITTHVEGGPNWNADDATTTVTVVDSSTAIPDVLPEIGDGNLPPKPIVNNKSAFVATNDQSLLVKWDKAAGLLTLQSKGVYTGFIKAEVTFTKNGTTYTCTNVFGTTAAMASKTVAQRKAALKTKAFTAGAAACKDGFTLSVPGVGGVAGDLTNNFSNIKKVAKVAGNATTAGTTKYEAAAQAALKGFQGTVTIKITRYRAWPTTMKNLTPGTGANAKKIPATVRTTFIGLQ